MAENIEPKPNDAQKADQAKNKKNKMKNKSQNTIAGKFAAYLSVLIFITVIFMTFYGVYIGTNLINKARIDKYQTLQIYTQSIVKDSMPELLNGNYTEFDASIKYLMSKNQILNVYIINKKTRLIKYSTIKGIANKIYNPENPEDAKLLTSNIPSEHQPKGLFEILYSNLTFSKLNNPIFTNYVILPNEDIVSLTIILGNLSQISEIYKGYIVLAILFLILGFVSAAILAKMVTKPIQELLEGVKKFAKREFSYRLPIENDDEIGQLAMSVNNMASELEQSYKDLEHKVLERTKELQHKNNEVELAYKDLKIAQVKLIHSEKMSSLGQLVAGVAHELNNPINFIYGNLEHLKSYINDMKNIITKYEACEDSLKEQEKQEIDELKEGIDYQYLLGDLNDLLESCKEGAERTRQIVLDLRNFSRLDEANLKEVNLHEGLDSTLNILQNKYKGRIEVIRNYDYDIPSITCFAGQLNQVFMNLLANAAQAIKGKGEVKISTSQDDDHVIISISDSGCGIPPENLSKIFDPFFTTKDVGEGTGLGLSVSYGIIEKHNGTISVESKVEEGTTFKIRLPIKWAQDQN